MPATNKKKNARKKTKQNKKKTNKKTKQNNADNNKTTSKKIMHANRKINKNKHPKKPCICTQKNMQNIKIQACK